MKKTLSLFFGVIIITACGILQNDSFSGYWAISFDGDFKDTFHFKVDENKQFSFAETISMQGNDYDVTIEGSIDEEGILSANINLDSQTVGRLNGKVNYENGIGNWMEAGLSGTWSAIKKQ
ncbi:MAG: hypothetical protein KJ799_05880 [Bacteroidetes bacterium]|nr:hypothetical protein [Bacteroidota bacterium]MBU1679902.1 hypothetical protein [Bacteroidota bacterium]MBU2506237.1 hypothetical protein [Bacteroidota bacterium]